MRPRAPVILLALLLSFLVPALIGNVYGAGCNLPGCQVTFNSNVPSSDGTIWIKIDNNTGNFCAANPPCVFPLPQNSPPTFTFTNGTVHTIKVLNYSFTGPSTQGHYVWKEWVNYYGTPSQFFRTTNQTLTTPQLLYNYTGIGAFTAVFDKQYSATLSFTDTRGNPLSPAPAAVTLVGQTGGATTIRSYSGQYISANLYTVTNATWEGTNIPANTTQTIDLRNSPTTATISFKAYPATVQVVDNNNKPVLSANVTITFVNGTAVRTFLTDHNGEVHLGDIPCSGTASNCGASYGLTVRYQNQVYGPFTPNAVISPTYVVQVNSGSTNSTTTTSIVLLAIFGIAFFLILLAIKLRRPNSPPRIGPMEAASS